MVEVYEDLMFPIRIVDLASSLISNRIYSEFRGAFNEI
jgi:hypothetical protein